MPQRLSFFVEFAHADADPFRGETAVAVHIIERAPDRLPLDVV